jgi:hypothetical protein
MQGVLTTNDLDIETTIITQPKLNKNKQLTAAVINSKTRSALYIETPYLINPFGLSAYDGGKDIKEEAKSWSLVLKAQGSQNDSAEEITALFNYFKALDEKTIDYGLEHSQTIFKKKYDESQRAILVDLLYNRCVKPSVGGDGTVYPDKITLKVMKKLDMSPDVLVFKDSADPLSIGTWDDLQSSIPKGVPLKAIIQPRLYFVNGKMGINFRVLQIKLQSVTKVCRPITYAFSDAPAGAPQSVFSPPSDDQPAVAVESGEEVEDSEGEEEEEEEEDEDEEEVTEA